MRRFVPLILASLAAASAVPTLAAAQLKDVPQRRAGLWDMSVSMVMAGRPFVRQMQMCTDAATEKSAGPLAGSTAANCSQLSSSRTPAGWSFASTCNVSGATLSTTGLATGDFQSSYHIETSSKRNPAPAGVAASHMVMDGKWLGPCPAGRKPGDITMTGGAPSPRAPR